MEILQRIMEMLSFKIYNFLKLIYKANFVNNKLMGHSHHGTLCLCQFVHPEHKVSDLPSLRLYHISKRYYVLHLYWSQSGISKPSEHYDPCYKHISFKPSYPALCFTEVYFSLRMHHWKTRDGMH